MNIIRYIFIIFIYTNISCFSNNYENLYNWLISNNAFISKKIIPVEQDLFNRYIITKENIEKNEEILFIPNKLTISTLNNIVLDICNIGFKDFISYASKEEKSSYDFDCLVYFLTIDMNNNNSFFKDFYNYFPEISKNDFSLYFSKEKINLLKEIELDYEIQRQKYFYEKSIKYIKEKIKKIKNGLEIYKKNFILVSTRNMERRNSFFEEVNTLVPYLDLINHNNNYNSYFIYDEKRDGFCLYSIKNINKNEEITISYGKLNNIYLYSIYGFTIKNNIYKPNINIKIYEKKITLFPNFKKDEIIIKIIKQFKNINKKEIIKELKKSLNKRLNEYQNILHIFNNDINIINICNDLIYSINKFLILCDEL